VCDRTQNTDSERGRDCREEDGAGKGWSEGTVRVVDALTPALRCSRDYRTHCFAECFKHSIDKGQKTLDKLFARCDSRQRVLGEPYIGNGFFAEYFLLCTQC
jgi:hypothetical protein